jgi:hypothetical protein
MDFDIVQFSCFPFKTFLFGVQPVVVFHLTRVVLRKVKMAVDYYMLICVGLF